MPPSVSPAPYNLAHDEKKTLLTPGSHEMQAGTSDSKEIEDYFASVAAPHLLSKATTATSDVPHYIRRSCHHRFVRTTMLAISLGLTSLVLAATMYAVEVGHLRFFTRDSCRGASAAAARRIGLHHDAGSGAVTATTNIAMGRKFRWKRSVNGSTSTPSSTSDHPQYSYSTESDGEIDTFVYTTRPIVNPGGYTVGTLTGYVPFTSSPTSASTSTSSTGSNASPSPTNEPTPISTSNPLTTTTATTTNPSTTSTSSTPLASPTATPVLEELRGPLLHRRNLPEDPQAQEPFAIHSPPEGDDDEREYSYAIKDGKTLTYIKTTRAIVNPAGFTIGTLDGVYVRYKPEATTLPTRVHDDLRKRARTDEK